MQDTKELSSTAKELSQVALRKSEETLAVTLDSIADGVISTDIEGDIINMNRVAQHLTGWTLSEAKGRGLAEVFNIVDGETGANLKSPFEAVMSVGAAVRLAPNTVLVARNGEHYLMEDSAAPIKENIEGPISGIVLVFRDVTEKSKLDLEFQQAKKLESIGRLAGGVAHDFNNLLAGIIGYSEMLLLELHSDPRLQSYARAALDTAERAAKLTNQLLAFSRKGKMVSLPVDLHTSITSVINLLKSTTDRRISISASLDASSATVMGDPTLLESALLNLAINARDATAIGGAITIETNTVRLDQNSIAEASLDIESGEYVEIKVSDTGQGMSDEVKDHLFEPFFTTKEFGRGTGLGLAAVYGTAKEHHGAIKAKSNLGRGTSFSLYLPVCGIAVTEVKEDESERFSGSGCVLLVDDELIVRETASAMLRAIGYEVLLAENGTEALEIFKREEKQIKLVILDVVMPRLSGPDTFFALKNINKDVKVIFSSGYTFDNGGNELLSEGMFGFIQKPFRRNTLYKAIQESLVENNTSVSI